MTQREQGTPWVQTNLGASIFGGAVVLILGALGNTLFEDMPNWLRWIVTAGAVLVGLILFSAINELWRDRVWVHLGKWIAGMRPVTMARLDREVAAERTAAEKEHADDIAARQKSPSPPAWRLQANGRELGDLDERYQGFWLWNKGFPVTDVEVTGDSNFVKFPHRAVFSSADSNAGQFLAMGLTEKAHAEGFTLTYSWRNRYRDPGSEDIRYEAEWISQQGVETPAMTYERGKADGLSEGHAAGFEAGRKDMQEEIDRQRARPVRKARWLVGPQPDERNQAWALANTSDGAVATEVTMDAPNYFTFLSAADWEDMTGVSHQAFRGFERDGSFVVFTVEWNDANGQRQSEQVRYDPGI